MPFLAVIANHGVVPNNRSQPYSPTLRDCDLTYMLERGRVVASEGYDDMMARTSLQAMARQTPTPLVDA